MKFCHSEFWVYIVGYVYLFIPTANAFAPCPTYPTDIKDIQFHGYDQNGNASTIISGDWNVNIDATVTVNTTIATNSNFAIQKDRSITILPGVTLTIENGGHFYSCYNDMWQGFIVEPGGSLIIQGYTYPVLIEDAKIAIDATGSGSSSISTFVQIQDNVTFNANNIGVYMHNGNFSTSIFNGTNFTCNRYLKAPYGNGISDYFSEAHIKAVDAGSIILDYGTNTTFGNTFSNAINCLDFDKTNLTVNSCSFSQASLLPNAFKGINAIKFHGVNSTPLNEIYSLNVGDINSTKKKNEFREFVTGINVKYRTNVNIENNYFHGGFTGVSAHLNGLSSIANYSGHTFINNNEFNFIKYGISLQNNWCLIGISSNNFNIVPGLTFNPALEDEKGIFIHNSIPNPYPGPITVVSHNTLINYKTGIQIMQQNRGVVSDNFVFFDVPDAELASLPIHYRRGFSSMNSSGITYDGNKVERILGAGSTIDPDLVNNNLGNPAIICGISEQLSGNNYSNNTITSLTTAIRVVASCAGTAFDCNTMDNGYEGIKLENGLISDQGDGITPNGNRWLSYSLNGATRINGTTQIGPPAEWFYNNSGTFPETDPTFNGTLVLPTGISTDFSTNIPCSINNCPTCAVDRLYAILANANSANMDEELRFASENYVYRNLRDSLQLLYSGSVHDAELQNFFTTISMENLGLLNNVDELLKDNDFANAYFQNGNINPDILSEENWAIVNRICANYELDFDDLDSVDYAELLEIAYQYPQLGGEAVYRARAILGIDLEDSQIAYRVESAGPAQNLDNFLIIPNPSSGQFTLQYSLKKDETGIVHVYDNLSKEISSKSMEIGTNSLNFNLSGYQTGIYYLKIKLSGGNEINKKVVLIN